MSNYSIPHSHLEVFGGVRRRLTRLLGNRAGTLGLGPRQLIALRHVHREGALSMRALGELLSIDPAAVTRMVSSMEKSGWVKRKINSDDRRQAVVSLAPKAASKMAQIDAIYDSLSKTMVSLMSKKEQSLFMDLLIRVDQSLAAVEN